MLKIWHTVVFHVIPGLANKKSTLVKFAVLGLSNAISYHFTKLYSQKEGDLTG